MRTYYLLAICFTISYIQIAGSEKCNREIKSECSATEYKSYVACIRNRMKRSADCYDEDEEEDCSSNQCGRSCDNCDCNECTASDCGSSCNKRCCSSCCKFNECSTNHCCHKVCHNSCRTSSCRSSCRRSCYKSVRKDSKERDVIIRERGEGGSVSNASNLISNRGAHNITTVIHLNNLINNTNLIDIPINLNNSNVNNITVENAQNGSSTIGSSSNQCCSVIEPRQCVSSSVYPYIDCFHYRRQQCGQFCTAPVVHKVAQNVCYNTQTQNPTCGQQIIYVPQPRTSCTYQPQWPYISCTNQGSNCNGCYDYLLNPYRVQRTCGNSCYNYGMNQGALYRQGPVLNPGYSLPLPINPVIPSGCAGYGGCGLSNMETFVNPGMYYGMNAYNNYGMYGSYSPYSNVAYTPELGIQARSFGNNFVSSLGLPGLGNSPVEQFIPMNFTATNSSNVLYGVLTNSTSPLIAAQGYPEGIYGQPITIDEEMFKKLLGNADINASSIPSIVSNSANVDATRTDEASVDGAKVEEAVDTVVTTTKPFSLFG
ncbi:hypothetical protein HHI36_000699 [Cryptolaemus montrouzieri]|uniref:Uncharacterized protein n=1 Tax=Cryptolaemus montrouzieri TaxID=559131 RepID=A0ABD2P5N9_9CUCU